MEAAKVWASLGGFALVFVGAFLLAAYGVYRFVVWRKWAKPWRLLAVLPLVPLALAFAGLATPAHQDVRVAYAEMAGTPLPATASIVAAERFTHGAYQGGDDLVFLLRVAPSTGKALAESLRAKGFASVTAAGLMQHAWWDRAQRLSTAASVDLEVLLVSPEGATRPGAEATSAKYFAGLTTGADVVVMYRRGD